VGIAVAAGVGYTIGHAGAPVPKAPAPEASTQDARMDLLIAGQADVRNRLARLEAAGTVSRGESAPAAAPAIAPPGSTELPSEADEQPLTPEAIAAFDAAHAIVAEAIQSGRWSDERRDRMRRAFGPLGDEGRKSILQELTTAINSGKISLAGLNGPPL
jgi:hypothetical protein